MVIFTDPSLCILWDGKQGRTMPFNPDYLRRLEDYGMTNDHLRQLLGVCERGPGRVTWHVERQGFFAKVEMTFFGWTRDTGSMRNLSQLLEKER
jgi:hypothetical protein